MMSDTVKSTPPTAITPKQTTPFGKMDTNGNIFPVTPKHHKYHKAGDSTLKKSFKNNSTPDSKIRRSRSVPADSQDERYEWNGSQERSSGDPGSPKMMQGHNGRKYYRRQDENGRGRGESRKKRSENYSHTRQRHYGQGDLDQRANYEEAYHYGYTKNGPFYENPNRHLSMRNATNHHGNRNQSELYAHRNNKHRNNGAHRTSRDWRSQPEYQTSGISKHGRAFQSLENLSEESYRPQIIGSDLIERPSFDIDNRRKAHYINRIHKSKNSSRPFMEANSCEQRVDRSNIYDGGETTSESMTESDYERILDRIPSETLMRTVCQRKRMVNEIKDEMENAKHQQIPINFKLDFLNEIAASRLNPKATEFLPEKSFAQKEPIPGSQGSESQDSKNVSKVDDDEQVKVVVDIGKLNQNSTGVIDVTGFHYPVTDVNNYNQQVYTSNDDRNVQIGAAYPSIQNPAAPVLISNPSQSISCFPQAISYQNEPYNVNGTAFETVQNCIPSPAQFAQDIVYPQPTYMPTVYPNASDSNQVVYAAPYTSVQPMASYQPMTPLIMNHQMQTPLQTREVTPVAIYDGQQLVSLPSAPNPVMTRMEVPVRQAHTDPQTAHTSHQFLHQPPVLNLQAYCLTLDRDQPILPKGVKVPGMQKSVSNKPILDRVGETLNEVRESLKRDSFKKTSKKCESRKIWEEIIMKLIKIPKNYEPKELHSLKKYIILHAQQALAENGKPLTNLELFQEVVDVTWPVVSQDINSPNLNANLINTVCNKNVSSGNDPIKEARLQTSRMCFLKTWCSIALEDFKKTKNPKIINEPQRQNHCRTNKQMRNYGRIGHPSEKVIRSQENMSVDSGERSSVESNERSSVESNERSSVESNERSSISSMESGERNSAERCLDGAVLTQDSGIERFDAFDDGDKDVDSRRSSLQGVCVGNRISYFESNTKTPKSKPLRNTK